MVLRNSTDLAHRGLKNQVKNKRMNKTAHHFSPKTRMPSSLDVTSKAPSDPRPELLQAKEERFEYVAGLGMGEEVGGVALEGADLVIGGVDCRVRDSGQQGRQIWERRSGVSEGMA
jgi:hypothetical protein